MSNASEGKSNVVASFFFAILLSKSPRPQKRCNELYIIDEKIISMKGEEEEKEFT